MLLKLCGTRLRPSSNRRSTKLGTAVRCVASTLHKQGEDTQPCKWSKNQSRGLDGGPACPSASALGLSCSKLGAAQEQEQGAGRRSSLPLSERAGA